VGSGLHVPVTRPDVAEQRALEQVSRLDGGGAATGWASLRLRGGGYFDGLCPDGRTSRRVPLVAGGSGVRSDDRAWVVRERLRADEVDVVQGAPCVRPERALVFEVVHAPGLREAVVAVDMACAAELTSIRRVRAWLLDQPGLRHKERVLEALRWADENSWSPWETRLRLLWQIDAGRPRPLCNRRLLDADGRVLGVPDLLDPASGVYGEFDGADHRTRARHRRDVRRADLFRRAGLEAVTAVGADVAERRLLVDRIHAAYDRAGDRARQWSVGPPVHWRTGRPAPSLDDRLDARDRRGVE
jgi:hypothetical protein